MTNKKTGTSYLIRRRGSCGRVLLQQNRCSGRVIPFFNFPMSYLSSKMFIINMAPSALLLQVQLVLFQGKDRCNQLGCLESMKGHRENDFLQLIMIYQRTTLLVELLFLLPNRTIIRGKLHAYSLQCSHFFSS